jgi:hypothetical protein
LPAKHGKAFRLPAIVPKPVVRRLVATLSCFMTLFPSPPIDRRRPYIGTEENINLIWRKRNGVFNLPMVRTSRRTVMPSH